MLHEHLQADVVGENSLARAGAASRAVHARRHVCCRGVQLGQQETRLTTALVANDVSRNREPINQKLLYHM